MFEFYYAQLTPVIQYRDLRTEVFQSFKEIGNTILFCLLLEKALVRLIFFNLLVYIIFLSAIIEANCGIFNLNFKCGIFVYNILLG